MFIGICQAFPDPSQEKKSVSHVLIAHEPTDLEQKKLNNDNCSLISLQLKYDRL